MVCPSGGVTSVWHWSALIFLPVLWGELPGPTFAWQTLGSPGAETLPDASTVPGVGQWLAGAWPVSAGWKDPLARQGLLQALPSGS